MFDKAVLLLSLLFIPALSLAAELTFIANDSVKASSMSKSEIKQIFLAKKTAWDDGKQISFVIFNAGTDEQESFAKDYVSMTGNQLKKHYLTQVFNGVITKEPTAVEGADEVVEHVTKTPGAIGFISKTANKGKAREIKITEK